ncbi:MAG: hypothetical protein MUO31_06535 [Thermodesulfovibrionales bacterium]|nr:hypothetical protein [Thermodesulfovibrionales bacterium]
MNEELLKVLDMSEDEQWNWLYENKHLPNMSLMANTTRGQILADLAFRLSGGKIAGKKPIEYIIEALGEDK